MPTPRELKSPPIREAIFDIRVKARSNFNVDEFSELESKLKDKLPKIERINYGKLKVDSSEARPSFEDLGIQGYLYKSKDEDLIVQFRIDGFTVNRLKPYMGWSTLLPVAMKFWELYFLKASPKSITRLALRYINDIPMPSMDKINLDDYLRASPKIPQELPQFLSKFFSRLTLVDKGNDISAHVVQTLERDTPSDKTRFLLDIDVFQEVAFSDPKDPRIENVFERIHDFKNMIFFNHLTELTLGQFE